MEQGGPAFKPQWMLQGPSTAAGTAAASFWTTALPRADYQGRGDSSRNSSSGCNLDQISQQSSSRRSSGSQRHDRDGTGKSRGYANFGKSNRERDYDFRDRESRLVTAGDPPRDGFESFSSCRPERDRLNRARSKMDTWNSGLGVSLNNAGTSRSNTGGISFDREFPQLRSEDKNGRQDVGRVPSTGVGVRLNNSGTSRSNTGGISFEQEFPQLSFEDKNGKQDIVKVPSTRLQVRLNNGGTSRSNTGGFSFEQEFPRLSSEDKNGRQDIVRVPSPGISTPIQSIPLITAPNGWNSVLADVPVLNESNKNPSASSLSQAGTAKQPEAASNSRTALSMAETVMKAPLRISIEPQSSIDAQKIEERTMRQCTLRPRTPSVSKFSVLSSSYKSKTKGVRAGDPTGPMKAAPQSLIQPASSSVHPAKADLAKPSQLGSFQLLSREQNGNAHTSKDRSTIPVSPRAPTASVVPHKKTINQKLKGGAHGLPLPLPHGPSGDRKSSAEDKHKFFQLLRTKSSNGSSTTVESGCQSSLSSFVEMKQDSCRLNLEKDFSLFHSGMKCNGNGNYFCEEANSSGGSHRHLSDNEENNLSSPPADVADVGSQGSLVDNEETNSSSELAGTGDEGSHKPLSDKADISSSSAPADSDDGSMRSHSGNEESSSSSDVTESGDEEHPAVDSSAEELSFLISLGWNENEEVVPLGQDEIADCIRDNEPLRERLQQRKLQIDGTIEDASA